jgi:hypothetical protein
MGILLERCRHGNDLHGWVIKHRSRYAISKLSLAVSCPLSASSDGWQVVMARYS